MTKDICHLMTSRPGSPAKEAQGGPFLFVYHIFFQQSLAKDPTGLTPASVHQIQEMGLGSQV